MVPSLDAGDDFVGVGGPFEGLWVGVFSATKRLMAAWRSTTEWKTPRFNRRGLSLAKNLSTALSQSHEVRVKWKTKRGWRSSQAQRSDACGRLGTSPCSIWRSSASSVAAGQVAPRRGLSACKGRVSNRHSRTLETCRRTLRMSACRGRPEVIDARSNRRE